MFGFGLWIYLDLRVPGHSLSWRYQMTNKRAKCLLINQQTVLLPDTTQDEPIRQRISLREIRHAISIHVVGMAEVVAETAHEVYYLQRRHLAVLLPQTCRETCHDGTGEGGSHHRRQCAALREYVRRTALRHHVGLHPAVG